MCKKKKVLNFSSVLKRFEPKIEEGTYFLYAVKTGEIWCGNWTAKLLLDLIDGAKTIDEIKIEFQTLLQSNDVNAINNSVDVVLEELIAKKILIEV